jgi:hypothetical protein
MKIGEVSDLLEARPGECRAFAAPPFHVVRTIEEAWAILDVEVPQFGPLLGK